MEGLSILTPSSNLKTFLIAMIVFKIWNLIFSVACLIFFIKKVNENKSFGIYLMAFNSLLYVLMAIYIFITLK